MSILNGKISSQVIHEEAMPFGEALREIARIPGNCPDCARLSENLLLCGGEDCLTLYRVGKQGEVEFVSRLDGLGETRQIAVWESFAFVSTRADGVFVCDWRDPEHPVLAYQIDSQELATGVDAADGVLAITNRHMGCELYDVRDPYAPKRLGDFLCGEAQSVCLHGKIAAIGDWMNRQVRVFALGGESTAREISRFSIDGYADGICLFERDGKLLCLAAGGHHSARLKNRCKYRNYSFVTPEMIAEGYGGGHGVELFDLSDPADPEFLAQIKAPPLFGTPDTWRVYTDGETCVFTDTMNGLFVIDWQDLLQPTFQAYFQLPPLAVAPGGAPTVQIPRGAVTGAAVVNGILCTASPHAGVVLLDAKVGEFCKSSCEFPEIPQKKSSAEWIFRSSGQLHSFWGWNGTLLCACGSEGIVQIDRAGNRLAQFPVQGICHDLCFSGEFLITAEGMAGAACYRMSDQGPVETGRVRFGKKKSVREVVPVPGGIAMEMGDRWAAGAALTEDGALVATGDPCMIILLYHRHLARSMAGEYLPAFAIASGPLLLRCTPGVEKSGLESGREACPFLEGVCGLGETLILLLRGKYFCLDDPETVAQVDPETEGLRVPGARLQGIPFVCGNRLVILERCSGRVEVLDLHDPHAPVLLARIETGSHPEFAAEVDGKLLIACGHDGIFVVP